MTMLFSCFLLFTALVQCMAVLGECDTGPDVLTKAMAHHLEGLPFPQFCIDNPVANGKPRCYYLYVPKCASGNVPLVVNMHGMGSCPALSVAYDQWTQTAVRNCFALAYPLGVVDKDVADKPCMTFPGGRMAHMGLFTTNDCCCEKNGRRLKPDETLDMIVIRNIVQDIHTQKRIDFLATIYGGTAQLDSTRVYMTGHSNGCMAALAMGALYSNLVAAVACHAAGGIVDFPSYYDPVPTMIVQGMKDDLIWYQFAQETCHDLSEKHKCNNTVINTFQNGTGVQYSYETCENNASVEFLLLNESGHMPFLDSFEVSKGASRTDVDTTEMAWQFFSNYSKSTAPYSLLLPASTAHSRILNTDVMVTILLLSVSILLR